MCCTWEAMQEAQCDREQGIGGLVHDSDPLHCLTRRARAGCCGSQTRRGVCRRRWRARRDTASWRTTWKSTGAATTAAGGAELLLCTASSTCMYCVVVCAPACWTGLLS